jgi:hypothetical protein
LDVDGSIFEFVSKVVFGMSFEDIGKGFNDTFVAF